MKAIFPGSFDPIHCGHLDIIDRASKLFSVTALVCINANKAGLLNVIEKINLILEATNYKILVSSTTGLLIDYCKNNNINYVIRGIRNTTDFEFEKTFAGHLKEVGGIETVWFSTSPEFQNISSSIVRDYYSHSNVSYIQKYIPECVYKRLA